MTSYLFLHDSLVDLTRRSHQAVYAWLIFRWPENNRHQTVLAFQPMAASQFHSVKAPRDVLVPKERNMMLSNWDWEWDWDTTCKLTQHFFTSNSCVLENICFLVMRSSLMPKEFPKIENSSKSVYEYICDL